MAKINVMNSKTTTQKVLNFSSIFFLFAIVFSSCKKNKTDTIVALPPPIISVEKPNVVFYGLTDNNQLIKYNSRTAETPNAPISINGLQVSEKIMSIDFRPANGQLYGLGSSSRLYQINLNTGNATGIGATSFLPVLNGTIASIDFNPTVDRVRLVTNQGQNLRLHPETGMVAATDLNINGILNPTITSIAYTNSIAGATTTDLFDIDFTSKKLYKQLPPNEGSLVEVGTLNINFTGKAGFDITPDNSVALGTFVIDGTTKLYSINATDANTTFLSNIAAPIIDIAIPTNEVAYAISEAGMFQIFNPTSPSNHINKSITGLLAGESILGIDFRPMNGQLYGLASTTSGAARMITFNLATGAVSPVGVGFSITNNTTAIGFDFNPTVDRIRVVTNQGQNLRLNPMDGTIAGTDAILNPGTPTINGAAYTNNFAGSTATTLFVLDATKLYIQSPPNAGTLMPVGNLGFIADSQNGFDIGGRTNNAFAIFGVGGINKLYTINTTTGAATSVVDYPNKVVAMAVGLGF